MICSVVEVRGILYCYSIRTMKHCWLHTYHETDKYETELHHSTRGTDSYMHYSRYVISSSTLTQSDFTMGVTAAQVKKFPAWNVPIENGKAPAAVTIGAMHVKSGCGVRILASSSHDRHDP
jgi:hypothetical protein